MNKTITVIEPKSGWQLIDVAELKEYRDLFYFLVWKDIKSRYAQSVLGVGWAVIQPVFSMLVFTVVFGRLAKIESDGVPYAIFSFTALVPWTYFANCVTHISGSLIQNNNLISKIYFPRLMLPLSSLLGKLIDFSLSLTILVGLLVWYQIVPTSSIWVLPFLVLLMMLSAAGVGLWLCALAVQYRDIQYGMNFGIQLLMYAAPVVYPASLVPEAYRRLYALNPMVGVIEGFRSALLGTNPMPWDFIGIGAATGLLLAASGALFFKRTERVFADVA